MTEELLKEAAKEHGHLCPGLALGIRVSEAAAEVFGWTKVPEELVCTVDRSACYVDGIRFMTGCSPANRRLTCRNDGKWEFDFTLDGRTVSVGLKSRPDFSAGKEAMIQKIISSDINELFTIREYNSADK